MAGNCEPRSCDASCFLDTDSGACCGPHFMCDNDPMCGWTDNGQTGSCSTTCGPGTIAHTWTCSSGACTSPNPNPDGLDDCNLGACPVTAVPWTDNGPGVCSPACGPGSQSRVYTCPSGNCIGGNPNPSGVQNCNNGACGQSLGVAARASVAAASLARALFRIRASRG